MRAHDTGLPQLKVTELRAVVLEIFVIMFVGQRAIELEAVTKGPRYGTWRI
jgi:hypothetical protein